ncbi:TniQ family protein [Undibacterium sp. TS12]|uniref:TniQ family protein n=1 Tax=Undibacterium sp. TS12 TaxID=2908202 RepID=UPI001F4CD666|nr:TniQ family protein [Undibacterium sp. TS12]MCH8618029.1 TniQ family protein [Undibacterium sp. TS12]
MTTNLWLIRPKPFDDELLSSWMVRIAWHNVEKLESLCSKLWGTRSQILNADIDRTALLGRYEIIADKCGVSHDRAWQTTLAAYKGILFDDIPTLGAAHWVMPLGGRKRHRFLYGLQCCPACLREDAEPYYRRQWRLAFITVCLKHHQVLIDRCDCCGSPLSFHESDFGSYRIPDTLNMTICHRCGRDYRDIPTAPYEKCQWGHFVEAFQKIAESAMEDNWARVSAREEIYAILFFNGIRHLLRAIATNSHCRGLKKVIVAKNKFLYQPTRFENGKFCERLDLHWRFEFCGILGWILQSWPSNFVESAKQAKLSSSYLRIYRGPLPYWIDMPIKWHLDRAWYVPNLEESETVRLYLERQGLPAKRNNVRKLLGRWYVSKHRKEQLLSLDSSFPISVK